MSVSTAAAVPRSIGPGLDKPIYTISVASEILETHPRTLMMYESLELVIPHRTSTNRRRYSQRDLLTLQAIQKLTREHRLNLAGARYVIQLLKLLDAHSVPRPAFLADIDVTHVRLQARRHRTAPPRLRTTRPRHLHRSVTGR